MSARLPTCPSRNGDAPQGVLVDPHLVVRIANTGDVGSDREATRARHATPPGERSGSVGLAVYLLRIAGLTLACMVVAGLLVTAAIRIAAADHPNPWDVVQGALATALVGAAAIVAAFLAAWGGLGALILLILVFWTPWARAVARLRSKPERTTGGRERP